MLLRRMVLWRLRLGSRSRSTRLPWETIAVRWWESVGEPRVAADVAANAHRGECDGTQGETLLWDRRDATDGGTAPLSFDSAISRRGRSRRESHALRRR